MKTYLTTALALFFTAAAAHAQTAPKALRQITSVSGPVESIHYESSDGLGAPSELYKFDSEGNIVERAIYNSRREVVGEIQYAYDGGKLSRVRYQDPDGSNGTQEIYSYNARRLLSEVAYCHKDGSLIYREVYEWNARGDRAEVRRLHPSGDRQLVKEVVKYDRRGNIVEAMYHDSDGRLYRKESYKYDAKGNLRKVLSYGVSGRVSVETYAYEFDKYGNRVEITHKVHGEGGAVTMPEITRGRIVYSRH